MLRPYDQSRRKASSSVRSNCANPPLNGMRVMLWASANTRETSSLRRSDSAANMRSALPATA